MAFIRICDRCKAEQLEQRSSVLGGRWSAKFAKESGILATPFTGLELDLHHLLTAFVKGKGLHSGPN